MTCQPDGTLEWSLDSFGARTTKLWPFEAAGALGTAAAAKAPRGATFGIRSRFPAQCFCIMMEDWALSNLRGR